MRIAKGCPLFYSTCETVQKVFMTSEEQKILQEIEKIQEGRGLLALTRDLVFKAYFVKAEKVLVFLLNTFLPLPKGSVIVDVQITNPELTPENLSPESGQFGKTNILDLKIHFEVADEDGNKRKEEALVEMQTSVDGHFTDRLLFYASRVYGQQLKRGEEYKDLVPVYCLGLPKKSGHFLKLVVGINARG